MPWPAPENREGSLFSRVGCSSCRVLKSRSGRVLGRRGEAMRGRARRWRGVASSQSSQLLRALTPSALGCIVAASAAAASAARSNTRRPTPLLPMQFRLASRPVPNPAIQPARPSARDDCPFFPLPWNTRSRCLSGAAALAALQLARPPFSHRAASSPPLPLGPPRTAPSSSLSPSSPRPRPLSFSSAPSPLGFLPLARQRLHLR